MGYMSLHSIVVSAWNDDIESAHAKASELFKWVSPISLVHTNGYRSFFVPPDGSKEGWDESDKGNDNRAAFIQWMREQETYLDWVEVQYGNDDGITRICSHSDDEGASDSEWPT